jgi:membrane protein implicated in regulation of membrane protease activity
LGGLILFRPLETVSPALPELTVNPWLLGGATATMAAFLVLVIGQVARTRGSPILTGYEHYFGQLALVHQELAPTGRVRFDSQLWFARVQPPQVVPVGEKVRVIDIDSLTLIVEPTETTEVRPLPVEGDEPAEPPSSVGSANGATHEATPEGGESGESAAQTTEPLADRG